MSGQAPPGDTQAPRPGEEVDAGVIAGFLSREMPGFNGEVEIAQFPGGASNLTYLVSAGDREWVLRRPPPGTKARSAHDMGREYRILSRLHAVFPYAPRPVLFCADRDLLGEEFYLMERLEGLILRRDLPEGVSLSPADAEALCRNLVDVHAELHAVDYAAAGLEELGHPEGYVGRQVEGWSRRYRTARTDDVPDNETLMTWLEAHRPPESPRAAIIHNDYKFDNVVLQAQGGRLAIVGVLDWEMATLGDPLMDLGASLAYWVEAGDPPPMQQIRMMPTHLPGMMTRRQLVDAYLERARLSAPTFDFYYVYGLFRLAVIVQQIYYRFVHGQTRNPRFAPFGQFCTVLSRRAEAVAAGEAAL
ncbi:MAG: phosphotransferase family protein [Gammaproteobacteria bacterium]